MDKVKEAIDLLSLALNEGVKDSNNDICLSSSHCSASSTSNTCSSMCGSGSISTPNTRTSSSSSSSSSSSETSKSSCAMVACGKALDVLTRRPHFMHSHHARNVSRELRNMEISSSSHNRFQIQYWVPTSMSNSINRSISYSMLTSMSNSISI